MSEENKQVATVPASRPAPIAMSEDKFVEPKTVEDLYRYASIMVKSGLVPRQFDSPEKVIVAWQLAHDLGLKKSSIRKMYVVNGVPSLFGDLPLAVVQSSGKLKSITEIQFDANGKAISPENGNMDADCVSAVCRVVRSDGQVIERSFTAAEAKKAGLFKNDTYNKYLRRMLQMRSRSWALKDGFADALEGVDIAEYDHNVIVTEGGRAVDVSSSVSEIQAPSSAIPEKTGADELNDMFGVMHEESASE